MGRTLIFLDCSRRRRPVTISRILVQSRDCKQERDDHYRPSGDIRLDMTRESDQSLDRRSSRQKGQAASQNQQCLDSGSGVCVGGWVGRQRVLV